MNHDSSDLKKILIIQNNKLKFIVPLILVIGVIVYNIALYYSHQLQMSWIFNSDVAYIPSIFQDVILNGGDYSKWHLTPAPYIFPDMILYSLIIYLFEDHYISAVIYFTLQSLLIFYAVYLINRQFVSHLTGLIFTSIAFGFMFLFPSMVGELLFVSAFHMGEFVISLYGIYFVIKILKNNNPNRYLILLVVFSSLILLSDRLYLLHFILPCFGSVLFLYMVKKISFKRALLIFFAIVISVFVSYILYDILINYPSKPRVALQLGNLTFKLNLLYQMFEQSVTKHTTNTVFLILIYIVSSIVVVFRKRFEHIQNFFSLLFLSAFVLLVLIGNLLSSILLLSDHISTNIEGRYMIAVFLLPILIGPLFMHSIKGLIHIKVNKFAIFSCLILIAVLLIKANDKLINATFHQTYYPESVKCYDDFIDETQSKTGAAGYWISKQYYILSKHSDITIAQYITDMSEFKWITSEDWYRAQYDFFIIDHITAPEHRLDKELIENKFGKADKVYQCKNSEILYYNHNESR